MTVCKTLLREQKWRSVSIGRKGEKARRFRELSQEPIHRKSTFIRLRMTKYCVCSKKKERQKRKKRPKLKEEVGEDRRRNTEGGLSLISGRLVREIRPLGKASCIACLRLPVIIIKAVSQDGHSGTEQPFGRDVQ